MNSSRQYASYMYGIILSEDRLPLLRNKGCVMCPLQESHNSSADIANWVET